MKRFYKEAKVADTVGAYQILLDGRPVNTPGRNLLSLPNAALAQAIADEWNAQGEIFDPVSMLYTGFANAAIDHVGRDRDAFAAPIIAYAETDMLCYRAELETPQVAIQDAEWEPLLTWAEDRYGISFIRVEGIIYHAQPARTLQKMREAVLDYDDFTLAAMNPLTTIAGSLICVLALLERHIDAETLWPLVNLEELWQAEQWGEDDEARAMREMRRGQFMAASRFCALVAD